MTNDIYEEAAVAEAAENGNVEAQLQYGKMLCGLADRFVDDVHVVRYCDALLLIDFNELFWVVAGRSILLGEKRLVINLEPAEYKSETARLAIPGGSR